MICRVTGIINQKYNGKVVRYMEAPKMNVSCGVENCHYNKGRMCHASSLDVNAMGDGKAETSDGTYCSTFKNGQNSK